MTVGVAVVGAGFWGKNHVRVLKEVKRAEVIGVCETDQEAASKVKTAYRVPVYKDLESILNADGVEAVERWKDGKRLLFLLNHADDTRDVILARQMTDLLTGKVMEGQVALEPKAVMILREA